MDLNSFARKVKRGDNAFYRVVRAIVRMVARPRAPRVPGFLKRPLRLVYEGHFLAISTFRMLITIFYRHPIFQARCAAVGKDLMLDGLPFVSGPVEIHLGDNVYLGGKVDIISGRTFDTPRLILENRAEVGWNVLISVSKEVVIEEHARVSYNCRISDSDGHPREADLRAANLPPKPQDIRPVRICRHAWIGNGTHIMKGVTIGEGAIIGANSVVVNDIPPYCLALGNPAEVFFRNIGRPSKKAEKTNP